MTIDYMNQAWDKTVEFLAKLNTNIPLSAVLLAGLGLLVVVLILAICGCVLRKRLVPNWLIWTYFTFATIIICAHTGNDMAALIQAIEIPVLIVLACYVLLFLFRRRARYTYVEKSVYERQLAKGNVYRVAKDGETLMIEPHNKKAEKNEKNTEINDEIINEVKAEVKEEKNEETEAVNEMDNNETFADSTANESETVAFDAEKAERDAEVDKLAAAEKAANEAREEEKREVEEKLTEVDVANEVSGHQEPVKEESVKRIDKTDFLTARPARPSMPASATTSVIDMPTVNPIPSKTYEPAREPMITSKPVSQTIPSLNTTSATTTSRFATTTRPATSSLNRPMSSTTTTARPSSTTSSVFTSMYNPRVVKTTTTTTTTNTTTNRFDTATSRPTSTTTSSQPSRSTDDIMAAIERLRASMKK